MAITGQRRRHLGDIAGRTSNVATSRHGRLGGNGKPLRVLIVDDEPGPERTAIDEQDRPATKE